MPRSSPFESVHETLGANFSEYDQWLLPRDYGDPAAEAAALQTASVAFDLSSFGKITLDGPDSERLVEEFISDKAQIPADGKWTWAVIYDKDGTQLDSIRLSRTKEDFLVLTRPQSRFDVLTAINQHKDPIRHDEVEITDITETTGMMAIYGPQATKAVSSILPFGLADIEPGCVKKVSFMISVTIIRGSWTGTEGLELLCSLSACDMAGQAVVKYHKKQNIIPGGMECLRAAMAAAQVPVSVTN